MNELTDRLLFTQLCKYFWFGFALSHWIYVFGTECNAMLLFSKNSDLVMTSIKKLLKTIVTYILRTPVNWYVLPILGSE